MWDVPRSNSPRMHSTLLTSHFFNSSCTRTDSRKGICLGAFITTLLFFGLGKKSTKSTTPSSHMYLVFRIFEDGRYCCLVVHSKFAGGQMLKCPPLSLSSSLQKTLGESKSGLQGAAGLAVGLRYSVQACRAYQHIKSTLPSIPTMAQVRILPIKP